MSLKTILLSTIGLTAATAVAFVTLAETAQAEKKDDEKKMGRHESSGRFPRDRH